MTRKSYRIEIVVALIGLLGVLGGALIANWDKVFGSGVVNGRTEPGIYLLEDGRRGERLESQRLIVMSGSPLSDLPTEKTHVEGGCLVHDVPKTRPLTWRDLDLCQ